MKTKRRLLVEEWLFLRQPKDIDKSVRYSRLEYRDTPTEREILTEVIILSASTVLIGFILLFSLVVYFADRLKFLILNP